MKRVALIDDDPVFAELMRKHLAEINVDLTYFPEASGFLQEAKAEEFQLLLVDLNMADTQGVVWPFAGVEVISVLRKTLGEQAPIWVLTSYGNPHLASATHDHGAKRYLKKYAGCDFIAREIDAFLKSPIAA